MQWPETGVPNPLILVVLVNGNSNYLYVLLKHKSNNKNIRDGS